MRKHGADRSVRVRIRPGCFTADTAVPPGSRGFTLVELVLSLAIMSILMTGLASAIIIASHALPSDDSPSHVVVKAAELADQIAEELRLALWIRERTVRSVEFTVPDRDSDGLPERIRYAWSGTAGDPLTRQYNGGTVVEISESVQEFDLGYELETVTEEYPGVPVEGAEEELCSYDAWYDPEDHTVDDDKWRAQYFKPGSLPADTVIWRVTRVLFVAKRENSNNELTYVQLRTAGADGVPSEGILAQVEMYENSLPFTFQWKQIAFSGAPGVAPGRGLGLVFAHSGVGGPSARIVYEDDFASDYFRSSDQGASWEPRAPEGLFYYVYGTVSTPGPTQTATRSYVTRVNIILRTRDEPGSRVVTTTQTLNCPELLSGWWEADFDRDPRLDHNGDGNDDWVDGTGTFTPASLIGGVWQADSKLETAPDNDFVGLTTVDVRFRNTSIGGDGAVLRINADWSGGTYAPILACLQLQTDATQMLTVYKRTDESTSVRLVVVPGLSMDFVPLRLVIDPDLDTVSVTVDGVHRGTYGYSQFVPPEGKRYVTIYPDVSSAEFDYISVRVSE